jgi:guanosine-3',5'-bis(diphosphate) 3'-pyrophosphohydrolase
MIRRGRDFDEIFDLVGVRILVESVSDCWVALGVIHSLWTPVPGRLKDYIAVPKFNLYQSLHTTVVGPDGKPLEIQIRTHDMHVLAEKGIAAHWAYKESKDKRADEQSAWMQRMLEHQETEDDSEFLKAVRLDLFVDEVFVFTPKGDVVELPMGATPLDFAYSIHTEVGHSCVGARINGKLVPLSYQLSSGGIVEVLTSKTARPSRDWLDVVTTPRARTKIKQWFTRERREEAIAEGREALIKALRRAGMSVQSTLAGGRLESALTEMKLPSLETLYIEIGEGRISAQTMVTKLIRSQIDELSDEDEPLAQPQIKTRSRPTESVIVKGVDDVWVKLARCCMPVPGDPIVGFITRGRGLSVHRQDCRNADSFDTERLLEVEWDPAAAGTFLVEIQVEALDRPKLLRDVTTTISDMGMNILNATSNVGGGIALLRFTFELAEPAQLKKMLDSIRIVEAVYDVYRITPTRA